jgi:RNA-directed DNA polymerase
MQTSDNKYGVQMQLPLAMEWTRAGSVWCGADVFLSAKRPSEEWLSDCEKERTLTAGLMDRVSELSNLERACRHVMSNRGRGGVDGMEVSELGEWFTAHWRDLQKSLLAGSYRPQAVRGVEIPKASGGKRLLGIPTVVDRVVQQALHQVLSVGYERVFSESSYGFRPNRSAHQALHQAAEHVSEGKNWVVDLDIAKFFDEVNHDRLMWLLSRRIGDKRVLKLIHRFLETGLMLGGIESQRIKGTPQGGPLSPLLGNIVLDELDKELERRGHDFVRYADDVIILVGSELAAHRVLHSVSEYLAKRLKLRVSETKSRVCRPSELNFLGHRIFSDGSLGLSPESERRVKAEIRWITRRNRGVSLGQVIEELNRKLIGWLHYFRHARMKGKIRNLFSWLKRKLRCYRLKQGKRPIGVMRMLHRLGVPKHRAWTTAASRKGWWRKANTPAANEGMNNQWFTAQGLEDFNALYLRLHPKETAVYESTHGGVRGR